MQSMASISLAFADIQRQRKTCYDENEAMFVDLAKKKNTSDEFDEVCETCKQLESRSNGFAYSAFQAYVASMIMA